jgi:putative inorganic carbon (hco3(-)) transporter
MRDLLIVSLVMPWALVALRRPWIGVLLWTWLSLMNPHRFTWGFAYNAPLAAVAAGATLLGLLFTTERDSPFKAAPPVWLAVFACWVTLSWLMGLDVAGDFAQWDKVMKVYLMTFVALMLLRSKAHILAFAWVVAGSIGILGVKGGLFTIATGGSYRVWGPPGTFTPDPNTFAVAMIMTIPLVRFLQLQLQSRWARHCLTLAMVLLAAAALGSQSRGALLAISAMAVVFWWRQKRNRLVIGVATLVLGAALVSFMPDTWSNRMSTIETYQEDESAMGRIAAWWVAWGVAKDYPFGVGFSITRPELFEAYSPLADRMAGRNPVAHSIYFQVMGHHGFVGFLLFITLWMSTWRLAARVRGMAAGIAQAQWCADLAAMAQVSLVAYAVGGAFLDLAYYDLPYNIMIIVVLTYAWVRRRAWETEPVAQPGRWRIPGLAGPAPTVAR